MSLFFSGLTAGNAVKFQNIKEKENVLNFSQKS